VNAFGTISFGAPTRTITFDVPARSICVKLATFRGSLASTPEPSLPPVVVDLERLEAEWLPQPLNRTSAATATVVKRLLIRQCCPFTRIALERASASQLPAHQAMWLTNARVRA
jgi:hypothetical protein